jgi:hypothetical protein
LLIDYFLREQAEAARGSIDERARVAERVAQILGKVANPFEFDLLAGKAADLIKVSEELLRREGRKPAHPSTNSLRDKKASLTLKKPNLGLKAKAGAHLLAIVLLYPELRAEVLERVTLQRSQDLELFDVLLAACQTEGDCQKILPSISSLLTEDQRGSLREQLIAADSGIALERIEHYYEHKVPEFRLFEEKFRSDRGAGRQKLVEEAGLTAQALIEVLAGRDRRITNTVP